MPPRTPNPTTATHAHARAHAPFRITALPPPHTAHGPTPPPPSLPSNKLKEMLRASLQRNDLWHLDPLRADYIAPDQFPIKVSNRYTIECSHATPRVERAHLATNLAAYK